MQERSDAATAVQQLDWACFQGNERTDIANELHRPFTRAWAARVPAFEANETWVGYVMTWLVADELHILNVATDPRFRRRGVGRALIREIVQFARSSEVRLVLLEVRRSNHAAIQLYRSFGFNVLGLRKGYYASDGEDALEMALVLDPETGDIVPGHDEVQLEEV